MQGRDSNNAKGRLWRVLAVEGSRGVVGVSLGWWADAHLEGPEVRCGTRKGRD